MAQYFGLKTKQCCPFHKEKTASFSISQSKQIFKCFGCNKAGDSITLVSELLHINAYEAAKQINDIFSLGVDFGQKVSYVAVNKYKQKSNALEAFKKWENKTFQLLCDYLHILWHWEELKDPENELYIEALQQINKIEYYIDFFIEGTQEDKLWFYKNNKKRSGENWKKS